MTTYIFDYVGARANITSPAQAILNVPVSSDPRFHFFFVLAFAQDDNVDGNFVPTWDESITPDVIAQRQGSGNCSFYASLARNPNSWQPPSDQQDWINNATSSLLNLSNTYHLDGFDLDYENGLDDSFVSCMGPVMQNVFNQTQKYFTLAPFGQTYGVNPPSGYYKLLQNYHSYIGFNNYQAYADFENSFHGLDVQEKYKDLYAQLAQANPKQNLNGYGSLGLGIDTNTQSPRGLQPADILFVWKYLHQQGVQSTIIWSLEDSASNGYYIENFIQDNIT